MKIVPFEYEDTLDSPSDLLLLAVKTIDDKILKKMGFADVEEVHSYLRLLIFGFSASEAELPEQVRIPADLLSEVITSVESTVRKCALRLPSNLKRIYIYPTYSRSIMESMKGVVASTPHPGIIFLFISPLMNNKGLKNVKTIVAHEYHHSVRFEYREPITLLDQIISEGLADNFSEAILGSQPFWTKSLNEKKSYAILEQIRKRLSSEDYDIYESIFFGKGYPMWTGYSIGYNLVADYISRLRDLDWIKLTKVDSVDLYRRAGRSY